MSKPLTGSELRVLMDWAIDNESNPRVPAGLVTRLLREAFALRVDRLALLKRSEPLAAGRCVAHGAVLNLSRQDTVRPTWAGTRLISSVVREGRFDVQFRADRLNEQALANRRNFVRYSAALVQHENPSSDHRGDYASLRELCHQRVLEAMVLAPPWLHGVTPNNLASKAIASMFPAASPEEGSTDG